MLDDEITQEDLAWCDRGGYMFERQCWPDGPWYTVYHRDRVGIILGEAETLGEAIREATMRGWVN